MLTQSKIRVILRWTHIVLGLVLMCYIYSPFGKERAYQLAVKFFVIPCITLTGIWMWKFKVFNKFFKINN